MTRYLINLAIFVAGLATVGWIGAGYLGSNAMALAVTLLIAAFYLTGVAELWRHQQVTDTLERALEKLSTPPADLSVWLTGLHPGLRNPVRLRIAGERAGLPAPALTPYLVGLLVLLGMLGTFLGMVATLRGTGLALESATDLQAIRGSLAAPVHGLGFAFGTSIAGVATSAALGLLSALSRSRRIAATQRLDAAIATTLRGHSRLHQREEAFKLLQKQADAIPAVADKLQTMMTALERQHQALNERLLASQEAFHGKTETVYARLAENVGQTLAQSVTDSARAAGAAIQPAVESTLAGLAREAGSWHDALAQTTRQQLEGLSGRFEATTAKVADIWNQALASQRQTNETLAQDLRASLDRYAESFEQRSAQLLENVSNRLDASADNVAGAWSDALARQESASAKLAEDSRQSLAAAAARFEQQAAALQQTASQALSGLHVELAARDEQRLAAWSSSLNDMAAALRQEWAQAGAQTAGQQQAILAALSQAADDIAARAQAQTLGTLAEIDRLVQAAADAPKAALAMQQTLAERDEQRIASWTASLADMAAALRQEWTQAGAQTAGQQQEILAALARAADDIAARAQEQTLGTLAEIDRLVQAAADAPKAALAMQQTLAERDEQRIASWTASLADMVAALRQEWQQAGAHAAARQQEICDALARSAGEIASQAKAQTQDTLAGIERLVEAAAEAPKAAVALQQDLAARDEQRLSSWTASLFDMAAALRNEWEQTSGRTAGQQQALIETLTQTARTLTEQAQAQTRNMLDEVNQLLQAAAEAPRAAAEAMAELRQKLTDSMARDNAMLEERNRLLETLGTLLDTVNQSSAEQRTAIDSLVTTSTDLLDRVGTQLQDKIATETGRLADVAAQVTGGAVEVASLGEAFGAAVALFSESNEKLLAHLQRIEAALDKSIARSDEQLAYYVAQAREVVDLSMMSQKQILDDLQQLASQRALADDGAA